MHFVLFGVICFIVGWLFVDKPGPHSDPPSRPSSLALSTSPDSRAFERLPCRKLSTESEVNLCAQWRAAIAAERQAEVAVQSNAIAGVAALLSIVSAVALFIALRQTNRAINLQHPPRLILTQIAFSPENDWGQEVSLTPGLAIKGEAHIVNAGRETAIISRHHRYPCDTNHLLKVWVGTKLPLNRPYDFEGDRTSPNTLQEFREHPPYLLTIKSGGHAHWKFDFTIPANFSIGMKLYVMGFVRYHTEHGATRMMSFCREFNDEKRCFIAVDLASYELEE